MFSDLVGWKVHEVRNNFIFDSEVSRTATQFVLILKEICCSIPELGQKHIYNDLVTIKIQGFYLTFLGCHIIENHQIYFFSYPKIHVEFLE